MRRALVGLRAGRPAAAGGGARPPGPPAGPLLALTSASLAALSRGFGAPTQSPSLAVGAGGAESALPTSPTIVRRRASSRPASPTAGLSAVVAPSDVLVLGPARFARGTVDATGAITLAGLRALLKGARPKRYRPTLERISLGELDQSSFYSENGGPQQQTTTTTPVTVVEQSNMTNAREEGGSLPPPGGDGQGGQNQGQQLLPPPVNKKPKDNRRRMEESEKKEVAEEYRKILAGLKTPAGGEAAGTADGNGGEKVTTEWEAAAERRKRLWPRMVSVMEDQVAKAAKISNQDRFIGWSDEDLRRCAAEYRYGQDMVEAYIKVFTPQALEQEEIADFKLKKLFFQNAVEKYKQTKT